MLTNDTPAKYTPACRTTPCTCDWYGDGPAPACFPCHSSHPGPGCGGCAADTPLPSPWVRVSERLPEVGWSPRLSHPVLVFGLGRPPCIRHYEPAAESWYDAEHAVDEPRRWYSHWQPLPTPPRG